MDIRDRRTIKNKAAQALSSAPGDPKKTVLIYAGGSALLALVCSVITYMLDLQIANTGGLHNMGLRSILSTIQIILPLAQSIFVLFLGFGYQNTALRISRHQSCEPTTLLEGFRRFGPLLRLMLLQGVIYVSIMFIAIYAGATIFMMTPLADDFLELMLPIVNSASMLTSQITLDDATYYAALEAMLPAYPIIFCLFLALAAPIFYQYRMSVFSLFDAPRRGALAAMKESRDMMRHNRISLFKIDLGFWWYYLTEVLIGIIAYGDYLLPMLGITLPMSDTVSYFLFYILSMALQTGLYYLFLNRVNVTYATVYETLRPEPQEPAKVALGNIFDM